MPLLNRLFVMLFVRRKAQAHARAVLEEKAKKRTRKTAKQPASRGKGAKQAKKAGSANPGRSTATPQTEAAAANPPEVPPTQTPKLPETSVMAGRPVEPGSDREALIHAALAARKSREAEWDALTPAQKSRAIAGLGEGMAALVGTFGKSDRAA